MRPAGHEPLLGDVMAKVVVQLEGQDGIQLLRTPTVRALPAPKAFCQDHPVASPGSIADPCNNAAWCSTRDP